MRRVDFFFWAGANSLGIRYATRHLDAARVPEALNWHMRQASAASPNEGVCIVIRVSP